jgi:hypothetical protein
MVLDVTCLLSCCMSQHNSVAGAVGVQFHRILALDVLDMFTLK